MDANVSYDLLSFGISFTVGPFFYEKTLDSVFQMCDSIDTSTNTQRRIKMILIIFGLLCFGFFFYLQESFSEKELEPTESTPSEWKYMIDFNKEWDDFEKENSRLSSRKKTLYWYCKAPQHQKETIAAFHDIKPEELGSSSSEQVLAPAIRAAKGREKREAIKYLRVRFAEILESKKQEASATSPSVQPLSNSDRQAIVDQYGNSQTTKKFEDFVAKKIDYLNWMG